MDRLSELVQMSAADSRPLQESSNSQQHSETEILLMYDEQIKSQCSILHTINDQLHRFNSKFKLIRNDDEQHACEHNFYDKIAEFNECCNDIKHLLTELRGRDCRNATTTKIRDNIAVKHTQRLYALTSAGAGTIDSIKAECTARDTRRLRIIAPSMTDEQTAQIIQDGNVSKYVKSELLTDRLAHTVANLEQRQLRIRELERNVLEIYQLFRDLETLTDLQTESLGRIDINIVHAAAHVESADAHLNDAEDYQSKSRRRRFCCILIFLCILLAAIVTSIVTTVK